MPSIKQQQSNSPDHGYDYTTPAPKKLKTGREETNPDRPTLTLKWAVTNREDYHPLLLQQPYGITTDGESIVLAEGLWPHSRLQLLDFGNGHSKRAIGQGKVLPYDVTFTSGGLLAVTDHKERTVKGLSQDGKMVFSWPRNMFEWPNGIDKTPDGKFVVADFSKGDVVICDENGLEITSFKTASTSRQSDSYPDRVAVDRNGRIIVSDAYNSVVKVFSQSGQYLTSFGEGRGSSKLVTPKGVATDARNNILVADWDQHVIKKYDSSGRFLQNLATSEDGLKHPFALAVHDESLSIVVTEHKLNCIPYLKRFSYTY